MAEKTNIASVLAVRHEQLAAAARQLFQILEAYPAFEEELRLELSRENKPAKTNGHSHAGRNIFDDLLGDSPAPTNVTRLVRFFVENENKPLATPEIDKLSGIDKIAVSNVLWSPRGASLFETVPNPASKKVKIWRLKPEEFAKQRQSQPNKV